MLISISTRKTSCLTHSHCVQPINGKKKWPNVAMDHVLPPTIRRLLGRPKRQSKKAQDEVSNIHRVHKEKITITCRNCGKEGHNERRYNGEVREKVQLSRGLKD